MTPASGKIAEAVAVAMLGLAAAGCQTQPLPSHQTSIQTLKILRSSDLPAMRVGDFSLARGLPASMDKSVTMRNVTLESPDDGSLAKYLGKTVETDLRAAGKLDPKSDLVITGLLTNSQVDASIGTGSASLSAKFQLLKTDHVVFEKNFATDSKWRSAFLGAVAIPAAMEQYSALYENLSSQLLTDTDFRKAALGN